MSSIANNGLVIVPASQDPRFKERYSTRSSYLWDNLQYVDNNDFRCIFCDTYFVIKNCGRDTIPVRLHFKKRHPNASRSGKQNLAVGNSQNSRNSDSVVAINNHVLSGIAAGDQSIIPSSGVISGDVSLGHDGSDCIPPFIVAAKEISRLRTIVFRKLSFGRIMASLPIIIPAFRDAVEAIDSGDPGISDTCILKFITCLSDLVPHSSSIGRFDYTSSGNCASGKDLYRRVLRLQSQGKIAASVDVLNNTTIVQPDDNIDEVLRLFPPRKENVPVLTVPDDSLPGTPIQIPNLESLHGLLKMVNKKSSPGFDGISFNAISILCRDGEFAALLLRFLNHLLKGFIPHSLRVSYMILLRKANQKCRPINIFSSFVRLASKFCSITLNKIVSGLDNFQLAFSPGGVESLCNGLRGFIERQDNALLSIDFSNAFNSISRSLILSAVKIHAPMLYNFYASLYSEPIPVISSGEKLFYMRDGGAQGDPSMPALFSLGLHLITQSAGPLPSSVFVAKYLDDVNIGFHITMLPEVLGWYKRFCVKSSSFGLDPNEDKTALLTRSMFDCSLWSGKRVNLDLSSFKILGIYYSDNGNLIDSDVRVSVEKVRKQFDEFVKLEDPQVLLQAFRCVFAPKLSYLCRTMSPRTTSSVFAEFDRHVIAQFTMSLGLDSSLRKGSLFKLIFQPMMRGGLGIRLQNFYNPIAFLSSITASLPLFNAFGCVNSSLVRDADHISRNVFGFDIFEVRSLYHKKIEGEEVRITTTKFYDGSLPTMADQVRSVSSIEEFVSNQLSFRGLQKFLSTSYEQFALDSLLIDSSQGCDTVWTQLRDVWLPLMCNRGGWSWKFALPVGEWHLSPSVFKGALAFHYRCPRFISQRDLISTGIKCHICRKLVTLNYDAADKGLNGICHPLRCTGINKTGRHYFIGRILRRFITQCGVPVTGYETNIQRLVSPEYLTERTAGLTLDFVVDLAGSTHVYDQTVVQITRSDNIDESIAHAEQLKMNKYSDLLGKSGNFFTPLVMSALGYTSNQFELFVRKYKRLAKEHGLKVSVSSFYTSLSCCLANYAGRYFARSFYNIRVKF
jgi:hypothetical protein